MKGLKKSKKQEVKTIYIYIKRKARAHATYGAAYAGTKDLGKTTVWDMILRDRVYEVPINSKYDNVKEQQQVCGIFFWQQNRIGDESNKQWTKC